MRTILIAAILMTSVASTKADETLGVTIDLAEQAIRKGYGSMCSLEMKPVRTGGYYPCLDFGPYRYVRGYGKVTGLVIQKGKEPFPIFSGPTNAPRFIYGGPWETDVVSRMVMWWNENIEGNNQKVNQEAKANENRSAAADYISSLNKSPDDEKTPVPPTPPVPSQSPEPTAKQEIMTDDIKAILSQ